MEKIADLRKYDTENMYSVLVEFPRQLLDAKKIGESINKENLENIDKVLVLGMGGSAIGGDLVKDYAENHLCSKLQVIINRGYDIPNFIDKNTLVIASSYSGNTEETVEAYQKASKVSDNRICITTGGKLGEIANLQGTEIISLPGGYQPRCAIGYSAVVVMYILIQKGLFSEVQSASAINDLEEAIQRSDELSTHFSNINENNEAIKFANLMVNKIPVIYSSSQMMASINARWRGQFHENAKALAFGSLLPEMNHNEINSWENPARLRSNATVIFLRDEAEHPRVALRFEALKNIINADVHEFRGTGKGLLTRYFDLVITADWITYYLALLYSKDPTAIPAIIHLKDFLANN